MIGLDTNVLVRYFTQDDSIQSPRAIELIEHRLDEDNPGFVSVVAMVETAWVLERAYGLADQELAAIIERLLQAPVLVVEDEFEVFTALTALKEGRGDFADALLGGLGQRADCSVTFTFDHRAARLPGFAHA
jgi:predicted nucleic-acid-binding protein